MPQASAADTEDLVARAGRIRLACFDVDGTLTDGRLYFSDDGRETKAFHVHDGQGLVLLRRSGVTVAFVTARTSKVAQHRARELGVECFDAVGDKLACVESLRARLDIGLDAVAFMGDDLPDLAVLRVAGLSAAPADAHASVRGHVHLVTGACGGQGAVREFCDLILRARSPGEPLRPGDGQ